MSLTLRLCYICIIIPTLLWVSIFFRSWWLTIPVVFFFIWGGNVYSELDRIEDMYKIKEKIRKREG